MQLQDDNYCFACGKENPVGLKMEFNHGKATTRVDFTPKKEHQGWNDVVHGGILFTLMDEAMARMIIDNGDPVVTSRMEIKFLRPAKVNQPLVLEGREVRREGKFIYTSSKLTNPDGKMVCTSKGVYVLVPE